MEREVFLISRPRNVDQGSNPSDSYLHNVMLQVTKMTSKGDQNADQEILVGL